MTTTLTKHEVDQRVALLKRLKSTLAQQREKFRSYLQLLDAEKVSVDAQDTKALHEQVRLEEDLVREIQSFQAVIDPLEAVYRQSFPDHNDNEVIDLRGSLERLQSQVLEKSLENRSLLSRSMEALGGEIVRVRPQVRGRSPYATGRSVSSLVDITT